jgi:antitoxin (DNA-binding transcriptional repressor) of toxin-antitoxin stability system
MTVFNMHQAKTELSRLVAMAEAGEEVVIARHNIAVAKIVAVNDPLGRAAEGRSAKANGPQGFGEEAQMGLTGTEASVTPGGPSPSQKPRELGVLKGLLTLPDSFFDPLPEEELAAWEGKYSFDLGT